MLKWIAYALRAAASRLDPLPPEPVPRPVPSGGHRTAFESDQMIEQRNEDAFLLVDEDCLGYLIFRVTREDGGAGVDIAPALRDEHWPAVRVTMERTISESDRLFSRAG